MTNSDMENNAAQKEQSIGWEDVFNVATTISLGLYFFVNKKVSHNTWMYILAGACILAVGVCHFAYRRKLNKGKKKRAVTFNEVFCTFVGAASIVIGLWELIAGD